MVILEVNEIMRTKIIWLIVFALSVVFLDLGCQPYQADNKLRKVDSLVDKAETVKGGLDVDIETFKVRYDTIDQIMELIEKEAKKNTQQDLETALLRFEAIGNNYSNFIENYEHLEYENGRHLKRLKNLKQDIVEENIDPSRFDSIYRSEKKIINAHYRRAQKLFQSVTEVENNYWRNHRKLKAVYRKLNQEKSN